LRAQALDAQVQADAGKISADYAGVVALSIRQAFAATELTISKTSTGGFNTSDIILFMKGESWQENHTWYCRLILTQKCRVVVWVRFLNDLLVHSLLFVVHKYRRCHLRCLASCLCSLRCQCIMESNRPVFLYMNPALGKYLLEGLFRYQASGQYP
jgi:hypothetical protein